MQLALTILLRIFLPIDTCKLVEVQWRKIIDLKYETQVVYLIKEKQFAYFFPSADEQADKADRSMWHKTT